MKFSSSTVSANCPADDVTCLADGAVFSTDMDVTGLNGNEVIVGGTGCGKTMSIGEPRILHAKDKSMVIVLTKRAVYEKYKDYLTERGYAVDLIDLVCPEYSNIGYDPFGHVKDVEGIVALADSISSFGHADDTEDKDPFWRMSSKKTIKALMYLAFENARTAHRKPSMSDVFKLMDNLKLNRVGSVIKDTNLDVFFDKLAEKDPGNIGSTSWEGLFKGNADSTAGCIKSVAAAALDEIRSENILKVMEQKKQLDISAFDKSKRALFIITSATKNTYTNFINLLYTRMFDELINIAEHKKSMRLDVPVHFIGDDFACGSPIKNFPELISVFRASGISVSMLIQSESQLAGIYGQDGAKTIINNCDTYVYMGGSDTATIEEISRKANKTFITISTMKNGWLYVFRRGSKPIFAERYKTTEDPLYIALQEKAAQKNGVAKTL